MKKELSTDSNRIRPYFIEEIGCEGVSNHDIAKSLNADVGNVNRRIRGILSIIPELSPMGMPKTAKGSNAKIYLPTASAKIVVAKYDNEIGFAYLRFLCECERVAMELTPQLIARVKELEEQLAQIELQLDTEKKVRPIKRLAAQKTQLLTELLTCSTGLYGEEVIERHLTRQPVELLNQDELERAKLYMLIRQNEGVTRAIRHLQDRIDFRAQQKLLAESIQKHEESSQVLSKHGLIKKEPA